MLTIQEKSYYASQVKHILRKLFSQSVSLTQDVVLSVHLLYCSNCMEVLRETCAGIAEVDMKQI